MGDRPAIKKVGTVTASVSRNAGGLFESVRNLTFSIAQRESFDNEVFSLVDENTEADKSVWAPLSVKTFEVRGPRKFGYAPKLYAELVNSDLDIIHNHGIWMYPSVAVSRCARTRSIPYVVSTHGMLDSRALATSRWKKVVANAFYEMRHLKGAACLRALCDSEADAMRAFGLKNPICVIPNGMDLPREGRSAVPPWFDRVPAGKRVLLYLGRLHPKKGLPNLLRAWAVLNPSAANPNAGWHLVLAGWDQGGHEKRLMALAAELRISDSVSFVGPQFDEAKRASYSHADAFILPSVSEGLPMVVLEAWSYGLPVLMTPECNLGQGFGCRAALEIKTDAAGIKKGLEAFFSMTADEQAAMGQRGRSLVRSDFTWSSIGSEMARVYDWILGGGPPPASVRQ